MPDDTEPVLDPPFRALAGLEFTREALRELLRSEPQPRIYPVFQSAAADLGGPATVLAPGGGYDPFALRLYDEIYYEPAGAGDNQERFCADQEEHMPSHSSTIQPTGAPVQIQDLASDFFRDARAFGAVHVPLGDFHLSALGALWLFVPCDGGRYHRDSVQEYPVRVSLNAEAPEVHSATLLLERGGSLGLRPMPLARSRQIAAVYEDFVLERESTSPETLFPEQVAWHSVVTKERVEAPDFFDAEGCDVIPLPVHAFNIARIEEPLRRLIDLKLHLLTQRLIRRYKPELVLLKPLDPPDGVDAPTVRTLDLDNRNGPIFRWVFEVLQMGEALLGTRMPNDLTLLWCGLRPFLFNDVAVWKTGTPSFESYCRGQTDVRMPVTSETFAMWRDLAQTL